MNTRNPKHSENLEISNWTAPNHCRVMRPYRVVESELAWGSPTHATILCQFHSISNDYFQTTGFFIPPSLADQDGASNFLPLWVWQTALWNGAFLGLLCTFHLCHSSVELMLIWYIQIDLLLKEVAKESGCSFLGWSKPGICILVTVWLMGHWRVVLVQPSWDHHHEVQKVRRARYAPHGWHVHG